MKCVYLGLVAPLLSAQSVDQVRDHLKNMKSQGALVLKLERQSWSRDLKKNAQPEQDWAKAHLEVGPAGHRVLPGTESGSLHEARIKGPAALHPWEEAGLFNGAEALLKSLAKATLISSTEDSRQGRPTRHFSFELPLESEDLQEEDRKYLKEAWRKLDLWTTTEGVPVGATEALLIKGRAFLITFEASVKIQRDYVTIGDRLLVTRQDIEGRGSAMGKGNESRTVLTATPL